MESPRTRLRMSRTKRIAIGVVLALVGSVSVALVSPRTAVADVSAPSWWKDANGVDTVCDTAHYAGSYALGASLNGVQACGPRPLYTTHDDVTVHFFTGAWGELEWECVELVMRYMYQVYGIAPYSANGYQVVDNYPGPSTTLTKTANNGATLPTPGDILSFAVSNNHRDVGHTAVVTGVSVNASGTGTVTYMQQNASADGWGTVAVINKTLGDGISGWLHNPNGASSTPSRNNADFDGNNNDDLVLLTQQPGGGVAVNVGKSTGSGYWMQQWWVDPYTPFPNATPLAGDVNGDDKADYVYLVATASGTDAWVATSNGTSFNAATRWWNGTGWGYSGIKASLGDMNGDGAEDLVLTTSQPGGGTAVIVALSTQSAFNVLPAWWSDIYTSWANMTPLVGDVTGDKVADYTFITPSATGVTAWVLASTKTGLQTPQDWWDGAGWSYTNIKANMGDIDGNHASDIVLTNREPDGSVSLFVGKSTLSGFWVQLWWYDQYTSWDQMTPFVGNVNGDGNDDYGYITPSPGGTGAWVLRSTNNQLLPPQVWWNGSGWGYSGIKVAQR
jgi:hypothetical protein